MVKYWPVFSTALHLGVWDLENTNSKKQNNTKQKVQCLLHAVGGRDVPMRVDYSLLQSSTKKKSRCQPWALGLASQAALPWLFEQKTAILPTLTARYSTHGFNSDCDCYLPGGPNSSSKLSLPDRFYWGQNYSFSPTYHFFRHMFLVLSDQRGENVERVLYSSSSFNVLLTGDSWNI